MYSSSEARDNSQRVRETEYVEDTTKAVRVDASSFQHDLAWLAPTMVEKVFRQSQTINWTIVWKDAILKVDGQVHARTVRFGSGKAMAEGVPHLE